jgi:hypothetical protein
VLYSLSFLACFACPILCLPASPRHCLHTSASLIAASLSADLAGTQQVWTRWAQPLVARYEPAFDRHLAESKALAREWLHSNALRLLAVAQQRFFAWLAQLQQQQQAAAAPPPPEPLPRARSTRRAGSKGRTLSTDLEEVEADAGEDVDLIDEAGDEPSPELPPPRRGSKAAARGGKPNGGKGGKGGDVAAPAEPPKRFSSFSLASFYSARSADLQAEDMQAGLKAFPIIADDKNE